MCKEGYRLVAQWLRIRSMAWQTKGKTSRYAMYASMHVVQAALLQLGRLCVVVRVLTGDTQVPALPCGLGFELLKT